MRPLAIVLAAAMAFAACGSDDATTVASTRSETAAPALERCEPDATLPTAPEEWYRDTPRYVGNEQPVEAVRAWASTQPGFQEIWVDRDHNGWITVAFASDAPARQAELEANFPDVGVVAVAVDWNLAELRSLQNDVFGTLGDAGIAASGGASLHHGAVTVDLGVITDAALNVLAPYADEPLCISGRAEEEAVTGPQVEGGEGWRLLAIDGPRRRTRAAGGAEPTQVVPPPTPGGLTLGTRVEIATNRAQLEQAWALARSALDGGLAADAAPPEVDFASDIVIVGGQVESGSCPELITDVVIEGATVTVITQTSDASPGCTSDANPLFWAVAVERAALPAPPFVVIGPAGLRVEADLREAASTVDDDRTVARPGIPGAVPTAAPPGFTEDPRMQRGDNAAPPTPAPPRPVFPHIVEPGFASTLRMPAECLTAVGPVNGYVWTPQSPATDQGDLPEGWRDATDADGAITVELLLREDPGGEPTLDITAAGTAVTYLISDLEPAC